MIRLNVAVIAETAENAKKFKEAAIELVSFSLRDKGCISYDLYESKTNDDRFMIIETWESEEALKAHSESDHFKRLVPEMKKYANLITEKFTF